MEIAGHNLQHENVDVNNLWKWPMKYSSTRQGGVDISFVPEVMTWQARAGYYDLGPARHHEMIVFTDHSVTSRSGVGYAGSVILDLKPSKYVITFTSDISCELRFYSFMQTSQSEVKYGGDASVKTHYCDAGTSSIEFEVLPQTLGGLWFCGKPHGSWATFTDIVIREGVL